MDTPLATPNKAAPPQSKETRVPQINEYNIVFAESQNSHENSHLQSNTNTNLSLPQLELTFWRENISILDQQIFQLKAFLSLKSKLLTKKTNPNEIEISNQKELYDSKLRELQDKHANEIKALENEVNIIERIQTEIEDFNMRKYQLKKQKEKMQQLINRYQQQSYSNPYQFTRINDEDIDNQYNQIMTTSCNEMCRSRLGNKMLMSLDMREINKNQNFANYKLAYPVLKRKKIVFNNNNTQNDKKTTLKHYNTNIIPSYQISNTSVNNNNLNKINYNLHSMNKSNANNNNNSNIPTGPTVPGNSRGLGKKKITLDNYNNYRNVDNFNFVTKTVY